LNEFIEFGRFHGLIINRVICDDNWHRVDTMDKRGHYNGSYIHDGKFGALINWATMTECACHPDRGSEAWNSAANLRLRQDMALAIAESSKTKEERYRRGAQEAAVMLQESAMEPHPYLAKKGFPEMLGFVNRGLLLIPMRDIVTNKLNSVQSIDPDGLKKFMHGGRAKGSVFKMGNKNANGMQVLCEGYGTGISLAEAAKGLYNPVVVIVCFSSGNIPAVANYIKGDAIVVADNDEAGRIAAEKSGLPWVMPSVEGHDANDLHQSEGILAVEKLLRRGMLEMINARKSDQEQQHIQQ